MLPRSRTLPARIHDSVNDENRNQRSYLQVEAQPKIDEDTESLNPGQYNSKCFDDDGRLKRTGVLSLAWAIGQLGWIAGPTVMILFAFVILYTSNLLCNCYRTGDPLTGRRNYTYMDAVRSNLASISMMAIKRSNCFHSSGGEDPCHMSSNMYMIIFGITEIVFSQIPDFDQVWWLSIVAAVMSFTYSTVGLALGVAKVAGTVTTTQKVWRNLQALGDIAFAYSYSIILIEIQDTVRSPPAESKTMKKASTISIAITTIFYMLCGCMGYAAFGDEAPGNLLTGFGFYNPYWLLDIANLAIVIHLVGAYQVFCQPLFAFVEKWSASRWHKSEFITREYEVRIPCTGTTYKLNLFRAVWRTIFVVLTTVISMLMPFFNDVVGILGAFGFWPLTVYFPVEMYIAQNKIRPWTSRWLGLRILSFTCLLVSLAAACGSVAGVVLDLKSYRPFKSTY
ncbi:hypothetical protein ZIOFF_057312 [Zingiber officinale]|uniref:Amino acid transporter transmembrane domain-containing protein n=1 Tax=Zingiber officinale TaxID=94328 RepID=A0A8J5F761_ZINOF|nr:hypothetical protein ZIOFF_057312 [Zingiber officinale]